MSCPNCFPSPGYSLFISLSICFVKAAPYCHCCRTCDEYLALERRNLLHRFFATISNHISRGEGAIQYMIDHSIAPTILTNP